MVVLDSLQNSRLVTLIKGGAVGVLPTDTVYGLVCLANNERAVTKLYKLKERNEKPGTVIAASVDQLSELGIKRRYLKAVEQFWPNAISVIIPMAEGLDYLRQEKTGLAVRVVADKEVRDLLYKVGPLLTSSANQPRKPTSSTIKEAMNYFGNSIDYYVDIGDLSARQPSTIIKIVDDAIEIVRQGAVNINENGELTNY